MLRSERRSKKSKKKTEWRPRGDILIPGNRVEPKVKGKGSKYNRKRNKFDKRKPYKDY